MATPEGRIKARGRKICETLGIPYFPQNMSGRGRSGSPDDFLLVEGLLVTIEYKATHILGPTPIQVRVMEWLRKHGAITLVVHAGNVDALHEDLLLLQRVGRPINRDTVYPKLRTLFLEEHPLKIKR